MSLSNTVVNLEKDVWTSMHLDSDDLINYKQLISYDRRSAVCF